MIKIYNQPIVTLIARQEFIYPEHINWKSDSEIPAEQLTEFAGRLCYLSFGEDVGIDGHKTIKGRSTNSEYLENILRVKHGSVIEHAVWSFLYEGVSRSLTHELVRHRAGKAYSQLSQRYVDESNVAFVLPPEIVEDSPEYDKWIAACESSLIAYNSLLENLSDRMQTVETSKTMRLKRARQTARSVLPNCVETKIVVTGNGRALRHFIEMRGSSGADKEIRALAIKVLRILQKEAPNIFGDYRIIPYDDGTEIVETPFGKV
jgi:thymidylate synthase (FAD)